MKEHSPVQLAPFHVTLTLLLALFTIFPGVVHSQAETQEERIGKPAEILFFYSQTCGDCKGMKEFMTAVSESYPELPIVFIDADENPERWEEACAQAGIPAWGVPRLFFGKESFAGWFQREGNLVYAPAYYGFIGYRNQIIAALQKYAGHPILIDTHDNDMLSEEEDCGC